MKIDVDVTNLFESVEGYRLLRLRPCHLALPSPSSPSLSFASSSLSPFLSYPQIACPIIFGW